MSQTIESLSHESHLAAITTETEKEKKVPSTGARMSLASKLCLELSPGDFPDKGSCSALSKDSPMFIGGSLNSHTNSSHNGVINHDSNVQSTDANDPRASHYSDLLPKKYDVLDDFLPSRNLLEECPLRCVILATGNKKKVNAVKRMAEKWCGQEVEVIGVDPKTELKDSEWTQEQTSNYSDTFNEKSRSTATSSIMLFPLANIESGVSESPTNEETYIGARNRTENCMKTVSAKPGCLYIGIESGFFKLYDGKWYEKCLCYAIYFGKNSERFDIVTGSEEYAMSEFYNRKLDKEIRFHEINRPLWNHCHAPDERMLEKGEIHQFAQTSTSKKNLKNENNVSDNPHFTLEPHSHTNNGTLETVSYNISNKGFVFGKRNVMTKEVVARIQESRDTFCLYTRGEKTREVTFEQSLTNCF